jgi:hypothetical protein
MKENNYVYIGLGNSGFKFEVDKLYKGNETGDENIPVLKIKANAQGHKMSEMEILITPDRLKQLGEFLIAEGERSKEYYVNKNEDGPWCGLARSKFGIHNLKDKAQQDEIFFWSLVDGIGWGNKSKNDDDVEMFLKDFPLSVVKKSLEIAIEKRKHLKVVLDEYEKSKGKGNYWGIGDDGYWDLRAHIVGLGKETYEKCLEDPEIAKKIADERSFIENFEYGFNRTIRKFNEDNSGEGCSERPIPPSVEDERDSEN